LNGKIASLRAQKEHKRLFNFANFSDGQYIRVPVLHYRRDQSFLHLDDWRHYCGVYVGQKRLQSSFLNVQFDKETKITVPWDNS
jgi:hypothetical protein